jgi:hypothetical protein
MPVEERDCVRHLRFEAALEVVMNGRANAGVVVKGMGAAAPQEK